MGLDKIAKFLEVHIYEDISAQKVAKILSNRPRSLSGQARRRHHCGSTENQAQKVRRVHDRSAVRREDDDVVVKRFLDIPGRKIVSEAPRPVFSAKLWVRTWPWIFRP